MNAQLGHVVFPLFYFFLSFHNQRCASLPEEGKNFDVLRTRMCVRPLFDAGSLPFLRETSEHWRGHVSLQQREVTHVFVFCVGVVDVVEFFLVLLQAIFLFQFLTLAPPKTSKVSLRTKRTTNYKRSHCVFCTAFLHSFS